jgi:excisionase family DNA binding protein
MAIENEPKTEKLTLTVNATAKMLGISRMSAYQGVKRNEIPHIRVGGRILIPREALKRLLEGRLEHGEAAKV